MQSTGPNDYLRACTLIGQSRSQLLEARNLLLRLLPGVSEPELRGKINEQAWTCEKSLGSHPGFFSQSGQDAWLEANVFKGKRNGTFVEIGGYDGISGSNCLYFEAFRGWSGVLIEPSPALHAKASAVRRCRCLQVAVAARDGEADFLDVQEGMTQMGGLQETLRPDVAAAMAARPDSKSAVIKVPTRTLAGILDENRLTQIDYVSLDVEGGEMSALAGFPFERISVAAWTIEAGPNVGEINALMVSNGYRLVEVLGVDLVYVR